VGRRRLEPTRTALSAVPLGEKRKLARAVCAIRSGRGQVGNQQILLYGYMGSTAGACIVTFLDFIYVCTYRPMRALPRGGKNIGFYAIRPYTLSCTCYSMQLYLRCLVQGHWNQAMLLSSRSARTIEPLKGRETRTAHKRTKCDRADVSEQASFPHYAKEVEAELSSPSTD
jgi:hypothetical protein